MADNSASIQASVRSVFPNARFLNCWFHVQHNLRKKKTKRKIPDQFLQEVRILHYAPTPEVTAIARQKFEDFWGTKNPTVFNVFRDEYLEEGKDQWVNTCAPAGVHMTNNGTERYNQRMKTDWGPGCRYQSLTHTLNTVKDWLVRESKSFCSPWPEVSTKVYQNTPEKIRTYLNKTRAAADRLVERIRKREILLSRGYLLIQSEATDYDREALAEEETETKRKRTAVPEGKVEGEVESKDTRSRTMAILWERYRAPLKDGETLGEFVARKCTFWILSEAAPFPCNCPYYRIRTFCKHSMALAILRNNAAHIPQPRAKRESQKEETLMSVGSPLAREDFSKLAIAAKPGLRAAVVSDLNCFMRMV